MTSREYFIVWLFSLVPYGAVSYLYMTLSDGEGTDYWKAFFFLIFARMFFSMIEGLGNVLKWRVYGKRTLVQKYLSFLRENEFPQRFYKHDDFLTYLGRIQDGDFPASTKEAAIRFHQTLATYDEFGILFRMRMHSATEDALEIYSPKARAPALGDWGESEQE